MTNITQIDSAAQRARLLVALKAGPISTIDARDRLNILHPAGRAMELRHQGFRIETCWARCSDAKGRFHRVGIYILLPGKKGAE